MFDLLLSSNQKKFKSALKNILGFSPGNLSLYSQAFRHNSIAKEIKDGIKDSNERLEYLGDSVLSTVIADFLFKKFPYKDEGFLTKMRSKIVSRNHLNQLSVKLGLNKFVLQNTDPGLKSPSMHGDAFEALIGAIYLDKGFPAVADFIVNRLLKFHVDVEKILLTETDFKSKLIEWAQKEKNTLQFCMLEENGSGHEKQFVIAVTINGERIAQSQHYSKKKAEQLSAEVTCSILGIA